MSETDLYEQLAERHGHYCPMSTLGLRLGLEAVKYLSATAEDDWQLCYQARTCAVDGIGLALEKSSLLAELQVEKQGQHLLLCRSSTGRELSLGLSTEAMQMANDYRTFDAAGQQRQLDLLRNAAAERLIDITGLTD